MGQHRVVHLVGEVLGQVANGEVLGAVHLAGIGPLVADDDLEDGRLADAVAADQRDAPPGQKSK